MDSSTYSDANLKDMVAKGLTIPPSCMARARRLGLLVSPVGQRAQRLATKRNAVLANCTPQEAARALGKPWTAKRIRKHLRRGRIPGEKLGGHWYVDSDWMEAQLTLLQDVAILED